MKTTYRSHKLYGLLTIPPGRLARAIQRIIRREPPALTAGQQFATDFAKMLSNSRVRDWRENKRDASMQALHDRFAALERDMDEHVAHGQRLEALIIALGHSMALDLKATVDAELQSPGTNADVSRIGVYELWDPHIGE